MGTLCTAEEGVEEIITKDIYLWEPVDGQPKLGFHCDGKFIPIQKISAKIKMYVAPEALENE